MKKFLVLAVAVVLALSSVGCKKKTPAEESNPSEGGLDSRLVQIDGLREDLYPNLARMDSVGTDFSGGVIDVDLVFGKTLPGWQAVARAYEKIQTGVSVNLNEHSDGTYSDDVTNAVTNSSNDWDIFQGNRVANPATSAINLSSQVYSENHYAGIETDPDEEDEEGISKMWQTVLERDAYITDKSGSNTACYIMNSESLSTAWFVNQTAFDKAVEKGYRNSEGKAETPITWDDLISLCEKMSEAGYRYPLGLAGNSASVNESQVAWLFRIYGDQYYRELYPEINVQEGDAAYSDTAKEFNFSLTDPQPESDRGYNPSISRMWNAILDENNEYNADKNGLTYAGAMSDKFACLIENFYRLRPYLPSDFATKKFEDARDEFLSFKDDSAPVILLDYTGFGLTFGTEDRGFGIDFFDYPAMICRHETKHVNTDFVRDVGGNGGYLSVMNHGKDDFQNELNVDFIKFFMSPYGQSIYYNALLAQNIAPDGLSTVKDFAIPASWKQFFESDKISFNGLCDVNWFNNNFIYHVNGSSDSRKAHLDVVQNLLATKTYDSAEAAVLDFQTTWDAAVRKGFDSLCETMRWSKTLWQRPGVTPTAA